MGLDPLVFQRFENVATDNRQVTSTPFSHSLEFGNVMQDLTCEKLSRWDSR